MASSLSISIFLGCFLLEDVALSSAIALAASEKIDWVLAFITVFAGIAIGDLGVFAIGIAAKKFGEKIWRPARKFKSLQIAKNSENLAGAVFFCRFIPGTRTMTYFSAGMLGFSKLKFLWLTFVSVGLWVSLSFAFGVVLQEFLRHHWILLTIALLLLISIVKKTVEIVRHPWLRRALPFALEKWRYFEFWPAWFFYLPVVPMYLYLSLKYRSFWAPFYANPNILNGGLIGESKWDLLKHFDMTEPSTLRAIKITRDLELTEITMQLRDKQIEYPFVLKPDVGQRGFGVRIIHNEKELEAYKSSSDFDLIAQSLSPLKGEAGLFYIRKPAESHGFIFSITDKKFPFVTGNGKTQIGNLILKDPRARIIAKTYFSRLERDLNKVAEDGEKIRLVDCGNHCQGAIFLNGKNLFTKKLEYEVDRLAKKIPDFYFGRFDVRYESPEALRDGRFEIVELNGAGSEATHIWDRQTKLYDAHRTLFRQWSYLFEIGSQVKLAHPNSRIHFFIFFRETTRMIFRASPLSVSS